MILMELIDGKDFFDTIMEIGWLTSELIQFFFASFVLVLEFLHENDVIYRDIKPENAVVEAKGYLKIIDLGTARKLVSASGFRSFTIIGTPHYMAPEVINGKGYSFEADIWSMGVLLYELACGQFPYG
jgi:cGMP-dependent protein kinase